MDRILVPIDFSGDSMNALRHALQWANGLKRHIRLIHAKKKGKFDVPAYFEHLVKQDLSSVEKVLEYILEEFTEKYNVPDGVFDFIIREGKVYSEITEQAREDESSLIMMGTHGISGFEEYWLGSTAFRVVTKAPCPVLTIRNGFPIVLPQRIIVPIDVTNQTRQKVPLLAELAQVFNSELFVLGVRETETREVVTRVNQYIDQVTEYLSAKGVRYSDSIASGGNITEMTIDYAKEIDADLIAIMTEQTERPENIWLGAYAQQMVNHSPIPVLSIHPNE